MYIIPKSKPKPKPPHPQNRSPLTPALTTRIKHRLWQGETCESIAPDFSIEVSTVRGILAGTRWAEIPWPATDAKGNALLGGIPPWRRDEIHEARRAARTKGAVTAAVKRILNSKENNQ